MSSLARFYLVSGSLVAALAVAVGAFGAHGLKSRFAVNGVLDEAAQQRLANWETAARYQMYHALGLVALGMVAAARPAVTAKVAGAAFFGGMILFSGSLYALVLTGQRVLGAIVPIGGTLFIVGWICFAIAAAKMSPPPAASRE